jgi:hypothetical protein
MPSPTPRPHGLAVGRIEHGSQTRHSVAQAYSRVLAASRVLGAARAAGRTHMIERLLKKPRRRFLQHACLKRETELYGDRLGKARCRGVDCGCLGVRPG